MKKPTLHFIFLKETPIFRQLQYEEALLRADRRNWCLMNVGSDPAVVLGISGQLEQLVNLEKWRCDPIPLVRRFSGGGTVYVDQSTLFITLICQTEELEVHPFPRSIMEWTAQQLYRPVFESEELPFHLKENDYVSGDRKWGGNAQSIVRGRWLHHSSLLWDFTPYGMNYLLHPAKAPEYRAGREHSDFLCSLSAMWKDQKRFLNKVKNQLHNHFHVIEEDLETVEEIERQPYRRTTKLIEQ